ncbi:MAG: FAD-dependent oxidoreductase, partial [Boseongicola sp.]|nr:FAD-dependent oxidoreductase [Boseongicola sp.]
ALAKRHENGPNKKRVTMTLASTDAPAHGGASVMLGQAVVGTVTSGGWGHRTGWNIAYAFVDPNVAVIGRNVHIDVLGKLVPAEIVDPSLYDPKMERLRG